MSCVRFTARSRVSFPPSFHMESRPRPPVRTVPSVLDLTELHEAPECARPGRSNSTCLIVLGCSLDVPIASLFHIIYSRRRAADARRLAAMNILHRIWTGVVAAVAGVAVAVLILVVGLMTKTLEIDSL